MSCSLRDSQCVSSMPGISHLPSPMARGCPVPWHVVLNECVKRVPRVPRYCHRRCNRRGQWTAPAADAASVMSTRTFRDCKREDEMCPPRSQLHPVFTCSLVVGTGYWVLGTWHPPRDSWLLAAGCLTLAAIPGCHYRGN